MPQNSSSFTPFDRTVFVQAMFMSFNLVFSTIFNSLLRHRFFFQRLVQFKPNKQMCNIFTVYTVVSFGARTNQIIGL